MKAQFKMHDYQLQLVLQPETDEERFLLAAVVKSDTSRLEGTVEPAEDGSLRELTISFRAY